MEALYQKIEIEEGRLYIAKSTEVARFNNLFHYHPEYELIYINKGNGHCFIGNKFLEYKKGDLFLLGSNLPHSWKSNFNSQTSHSLVIQLNYKLWNENLLLGKELISINNILEQSKRGIQFHGEINKIIAKNMLSIISKDNSIESLLTIIMSLDMLSKWDKYMLITNPTYTPNLNKNNYKKVSNIYNYVHENYAAPIQLSDVSALINMTNSGFCRYFKKLTRRTFFSYLNDFRIEIACKLLAENELNHTDVCYKCGFQSISNFNKQFKLIMGFSPREYKKRLKA